MRWPGIDQPMHIQSAFVDLFAITNTQNQYHQTIIFDACDDPDVTQAVFPKNA